MSELRLALDRASALVLISRAEARKLGLTRFFTGKPCVDGHVCERMVCNNNCYECLKADIKFRIEKDPDRERARRAQYYRDTIEQRRERSRVWRSNNKDKLREQQARWRQNNKDKANARKARHRALEFRATPCWADHQAMELIYREAIRLSVETGVPHHVDHMVPLSSRWVCGLHNHHNLQVLPGAENSSKANRHWPDMFERAS